MTFSTLNWLVALALVCAVLPEFASCELQFEPTDVDGRFRGPDHELSSGESVKHAEVEVPGRFLPRQHSLTGGSRKKDLTIKSNGKHASRISYGRDVIRRFTLRNAEHKESIFEIGGADASSVSSENRIAGRESLLSLANSAGERSKSTVLRLQSGEKYASNSRISFRGEVVSCPENVASNLQSSCEEDELKSSFGRGDTVSGLHSRNSADGASTVRQSSVSRALLQFNNTTPSCPLDFRWMREFPWFVQTCSYPDRLDINSTYTCCTALSTALGLAESHYLRTTGEFRLRDEATVESCFASLTAELLAENSSLDTNLIMPRCFPESNHSKYVTHLSNCQGIETRADFERLVGPSAINSSLNTSCSGLRGIPCALCVKDAREIIRNLSSISPNNSDCLFYTISYAFGISNKDGPYSQRMAHCLFSVGLTSTSTSKDLAKQIAIGASVAFAASLIIFGFIFVLWKRRKSAVHRAFMRRHSRLLKPAMMRPNTGLIQYSFEEIKDATNKFSPKNYIGSGGFGDVYRGVLDDGLEVAVKRMKTFYSSSDGDEEFINEVNVINGVHHRNLLVLRGCCVTSSDSDGHQRLLIYDYMPNGSLHDRLFGTKALPLPWPDRRRLAIGMARGIAYLHNDTRPQIIHRDIKASNVLLDETLNAKVADFGLVKFNLEGQSDATTTVAGTLGYVAPEYALYGQLTEKGDVYSFGVVLLELMSGRRALDTGVVGTKYSLIADWAWAKVKDGKLLDIVDERIRNVGPRDVMEKFVIVGILCSHMLVAFRPSMEEALRYLEGDLPLPELHNRPMPINQDMSSAAIVSDVFSATTSETLSSRVYSITSGDMSEFYGTSTGVPPVELLR